MLVGTGLSEDHLTDPHFRCGFYPLQRLFLNAIEQTGDPHLGITLALNFEPAYIGLPAYTALNAACFRDGLLVLERFFFLNFPAFEIFLREDKSGHPDDEAVICLKAKFPFGNIEYFGYSSAFVGIIGLLKAMLRRARVATRAETTVRQPEGWAAIEANIGVSVKFQAAENKVVFPRALLDQRLPGADPLNHARLLALCEQFAAETRSRATPVDQVVAALERTQALPAPISKVATDLGYSERGLRRQLDRFGASYRKLVDQVREQRARALLAEGAQPIKAIAAALGFESSSNFARRFKRWTGVTPKAFRESAQAKVDADRR